MTTEEAIHVLRSTAWIAPSTDTTVDEAIEMACEALKRANTPQMDYPCNTCANNGNRDGECKNCVMDSAPIRWKTPSHYKPKHTEEGKLIVRDYDSKNNVLKNLIRALERASFETCAFIEIRLELREINELLTELYKIPDTNEAEPQTDAEIPKNALRSACTGCRFVGMHDTQFPCANCLRKNKDYYDSEYTRGGR